MTRTIDRTNYHYRLVWFWEYKSSSCSSNSSSGHVLCAIKLFAVHIDSLFCGVLYRSYVYMDVYTYSPVCTTIRLKYLFLTYLSVHSWCHKPHSLTLTREKTSELPRAHSQVIHPVSLTSNPYPTYRVPSAIPPPTTQHRPPVTPPTHRTGRYPVQSSSIIPTHHTVTSSVSKKPGRSVENVPAGVRLSSTARSGHHHPETSRATKDSTARAGGFQGKTRSRQDTRVFGATVSVVGGGLALVLTSLWRARSVIWDLAMLGVVMCCS